MKVSKFLPLIIVVALAACSEKNTATEPANTSAPAAVEAPAPAPADSVATPAPAPTAAPAVAAASAEDLAKGEKIYVATCVACHGAAVMGAPKLDDKAAWQPRIAKGKDALYTSALSGFKMMPPKGGNAALKDDEIKAAVDYMISKGS